MDNERLGAIKKRCNESTPGPWIVGKHPKVVTAPCPCCGDICECTQYGPGEGPRNYNSEFIAHAREDVPWLMAEIERLRMAKHNKVAGNEHVKWIDAQRIKELEAEIKRLRKICSKAAADIHKAIKTKNDVLADGMIIWRLYADLEYRLKKAARGES